MGIISTIGRRSFKVRLLIISIYILLILGSVTMIYPFLLMLAGTSKSGVDVTSNNLIPAFLVDDSEFYRKSVEALFNESSSQYRDVYDVEEGDFKKIDAPEKVNQKFVDAWTGFLKEKNYPTHYYSLGYLYCLVSLNTNPMLLRNFKRELYKKYDGSIENLNEDLETDFVAWNAFQRMNAYYLQRRIMPNEFKISQVFREFKKSRILRTVIIFPRKDSSRIHT